MAWAAPPAPAGWPAPAEAAISPQTWRKPVTVPPGRSARRLLMTYAAAAVLVASGTGTAASWPLTGMPRVLVWFTVVTVLSVLAGLAARRLTSGTTR